MLKSAQWGQTLTLSVRQMISNYFLCRSQNWLSSCEEPLLYSVSAVYSFLRLKSEEFFSLSCLLSKMFLGKCYRSI